MKCPQRNNLRFLRCIKIKNQGYASLDYELLGYKESKLVKLDIMLNGEVVDALSLLCIGIKPIQGDEGLLKS